MKNNKRALLITALTILTIAAGVTVGYYLLPIIIKNMEWIALGFMCIFILMLVLCIVLSVYQWIEELIIDYEWRKEREKSRQEWLDSIVNDEPIDTNI